MSKKLFTIKITDPKTALAIKTASNDLIEHLKQIKISAWKKKINDHTYYVLGGALILKELETISSKEEQEWFLENFVSFHSQGNVHIAEEHCCVLE